MKKSTLTKIICLAVLCLMVLPLVIACGGKKYTIYFDANGGTVEEEERVVKEGEMIGKLPTPKRDGFKFAGWFDEEDINFEEKISQRDFVMFDMVLVANWEKDENTVSVEFDPAGGEISDSDAIKYVQKGDNVGKLPTPTRDGYTFNCWTLEDGTTVVRQTTVIKANTVCVARWDKIVYCNDGTENHSWSIWQEVSQATCETAQRDSRVCSICGHTEYKDGAPAAGHDWSNWSEEYMKRSRTCYECQKTDYQDFKNVTVDALGPGVYPTFDGDAWGKDKVSNLINGTFEPGNEGTIAGKGTGALTCTLDLTNPTAVDMIYVKGRGSA
ncbi:MAG: InlB B-repeat-containing protein, partial [Clostridia bacterium]|nr:InlB B-repeat-containing protein [Clostridia bacterium]